MAIEIESFPIKNGGSLHSYVKVYQNLRYTYRAWGISEFWGSHGLRFPVFRGCHGVPQKIIHVIFRMVHCKYEKLVGG